MIFMRLPWGPWWCEAWYWSMATPTTCAPAMNQTASDWRRQCDAPGKSGGQGNQRIARQSGHPARYRRVLQSGDGRRQPTHGGDLGGQGRVAAFPFRHQFQGQIAFFSQVDTGHRLIEAGNDFFQNEGPFVQSPFKLHIVVDEMLSDCPGTPRPPTSSSSPNLK